MRKFLEKTFLPLGVNPIGLLACGLVVTAILLPWWYIDFDLNDPTYIYTYLIKGPASEMIGYRQSPDMLKLTRFLIVAACMMLCGSLMKGKISSRILLFLSSALVLVAARLFYLRLGAIAQRYDTTVQGSGHFEFAGFVRIYVWTHLETGFYIGIASGCVGLLATILHQWVRVPKERNLTLSDENLE